MGPEVGAAPLNMRRKAADSLAALGHEIVAQAGRWTLWAPVAFGLGAAGYMMLRLEPPLWLAMGLAAGALAAIAALRRWANAVVAMAPAAPAEQAVRTVEGWVVDIPSPGVSGTRLLIAPVRVSGLAPEDGLPAGIQFMAAARDDARLYTVGAALEQLLVAEWGGPLLAKAPSLA